MTDRFTFNFEGDRLFWVLEKLKLAAPHLETNNVSIHERLERALFEMHTVWPRDLPDDLREQLAPIRGAIRPGVLPLMTTAEAEAILGLRDELQRRIDLRA